MSLDPLSKAAYLGLSTDSTQLPCLVVYAKFQFVYNFRNTWLAFRFVMPQK